MIPSGIILGFHGCHSDVVKSLVNGETGMRVSGNKLDWLGKGIYFWAHDPRRALEWAAERPQSADSPGVVGGIIQLGRCLNLTERASIDAIRGAYLDLKHARKNANPPQAMPVNRKKARYLDNDVMETLHIIRDNEGLEPYDSVIGYFAEGAPIYRTAGLRHQNHLQICVRNPKNILGWFLPKMDDTIAW